MTSDANDQPTQPSTPPEAQSLGEEASDGSGLPRRKILIGSQRDPGAYKPKPKRDWIPIAESGKKKGKPDRRPPAQANEPGPAVPDARADLGSVEPVVVVASLPEMAMADMSLAPAAIQEPIVATPIGDRRAPTADRPSESAQPFARGGVPVPSVESIEAVEVYSAGVEAAIAETVTAMPSVLPSGAKKFPPPNIRDRLSPDLEEEFQRVLADVTMDTLVAGTDAVASQVTLEPDSHHNARVVAVSREDVFVELGGREQGIVPLRLFPEPPQPGAVIEVVVTRLNREEGLYEVTLPLAAAEIGDWSQVSEGILVEARVTGHNAGGLECEVNRLRAFIPVSQIALYRVENLEEFVDQRFICVVTEADPMRRNLVLSRRAVLEREREEARHKILESLAPGQTHEGVVRKLMDFGAFVDLGSGVDGLIHVSQLGWGRIKHPRDVVQEGQTIRVRVEKVDKDTGRIGLSYRDQLQNPWTNVDQKYPTGTVIHGRVVKLMEFGAFVEVEPGVEGLVHISELSHKRVARVGDVVKEGDEIDAAVLSVDPKAQRISLSMKGALAPPEPEAPPQSQAAEEPQPPPKPVSTKPAKPLKGGLGRSPRGVRYRF
jgi:predicted RNA-binding protein with RPS1 domain